MCRAVRSAVDCAVNENRSDTIRTIRIHKDVLLRIPSSVSPGDVQVQKRLYKTKKSFGPSRISPHGSLNESLHRFYCLRVSNARCLCNRLMSPERFYALSFSIRPTKYVSPRPQCYAKRLATVT